MNNGVEIPAVGLGTWRALDNDGYNAVLYALKHGYRHIDDAKLYENEEQVGKAINDWASQEKNYSSQPNCGTLTTRMLKLPR